MPDLDKGQYRGVPIVLQGPLTDIQYSAHIFIVEEVGQFGRRRKMLVEAVGQLRSAIRSFSSSQAEVSMAVNLILLLCYLRCYYFLTQK